MTGDRRVALSIRLAPSLMFLAALGGCKDDSPASGLACGAGTRAEGGACVPEGPSASVTCGSGTRLMNGACLPEGASVTCGPGTREVGGACESAFPERICGDRTTETDGTCVSSVLEPGTFEVPLVQLQRLAGQNDHMHLDEVRYVASNQRLYVCSYDFAVVDVRNPGNLKYVFEKKKVVWPDGQGFRARYPATGTRTGGCINLAVNGEYVYTTHRGNIDDPSYLGGWRLSGTTATQLRLFAEPDTSYEGIEAANGHLYVGLGVGGFAVYDHDPVADTFVRRGSIGVAEGLNHVLGLRVAGNTVYAADGLGGLVTIDVADPDAPRLISRVVTGGQARDVRVDVRPDRATVYVAAASAGLVVVDATDPARMQVIGSALMPGAAQRLDYTEDKVYVAAWNDVRAFDVSNPAAPRFIGAARTTRQLPGTTGADQDGRPEVTSRTLGIAGNGDILYAGNWHVPYSFRVHADRLAPYIYLPEEINFLDFGPVAEGESARLDVVVRNEGTAPLTVFQASVTNPAFSVEPRQVQIPAESSATLAVTYTASGTVTESGVLNVMSDDPAQPLRKGFVIGNRDGLGVGVPLPETLVDLVDGGQWSSRSPENTGKVQLLAYFATF